MSSKQALRGDLPVDKNGKAYTLIFASILTIICAVLLGVAATALKDEQELNAEVDKQSKILQALGLINKDNKMTAQEVVAFFSEKGNEGRFVVKFAINSQGEELKDITVNQLKFLELEAQVKEFPKDETKRKYPIFAYYKTEADFKSGNADQYIIPVYGYGLWSNCYGVLALDSKGELVKNLVYYKHGETPGLGGEIEKDFFSNSFIDKKVHNAEGKVALTTHKSPSGDNQVKAISGATFTMDGVNNMLMKFLTIYDNYFAMKRQGGAK
jgi:Na+-transporting NADH:ubiquinone oxidoreductase subunit C